MSTMLARRLEVLTKKILEIHGNVDPHQESKPYANELNKETDLKKLQEIFVELQKLRKQADEKKPFDTRIMAVGSLMSQLVDLIQAEKKFIKEYELNMPSNQFYNIEGKKVVGKNTERNKNIEEMYREINLLRRLRP